MKYTYILLALFVFASCAKKQSTFEQIKALEQSDEIGTSEGLAKLAKLHKQYGLENNDSLANTYLYAAATHYFHEKNLEESKSIFETYLDRNDSGIRLKNAYFMMADIYSADGDYETMDQMITNGLGSDKPNNMQWNALIRMYSTKLESGAEASLNDYTQLSKGYQALGRPDMGLSMLDSAITKFPDSEKRSSLVFRAGFVAWEYLNDVTSAQKYYELFLQDYPNHELAPEVQGILDNNLLQMSTAEILDLNRKKNN